MVQEEGFGLILIELDGLAEINSGESYAAGDAAIKASAKAVQAAAVRCGGSAVAIGQPPRAALPGARRDDAREVAQESATPCRSVAARSGVAAWRNGESGDEAITRARAARTVPA